MMPAPSSRHYTGPGRALPGEWVCPQCTMVNTGAFDQGCTSCGAGRPRAEAGRPIDPVEVAEEANVADPNEPLVDEVMGVLGAEPPLDLNKPLPPITHVVTVYRLIEYRGPAKWVEETVARSLSGRWEQAPGNEITAIEVEAPPGTDLHRLIDVARKQPARRPGWWMMPPEAPTKPQDVTAIQLYVNHGPGQGGVQLVAPTIIRTLVQALTFYAEHGPADADPNLLGDAACMDLAAALSLGHKL